jgi:dienelactone hydrolase
MDVPLVPDEYASGSFEHQTPLGVISRRVLRRDAPGPTVILIHESPGISNSTFAIAAVLASHGYRIVLPVLLDAAWTGRGRRRQLASVIKLCVARELSALSAGKTGAIVDWLRGLADEEFRSTGGRPVGVIGMCFSGGFALGVITNPHVGAAVMSQPALPFRLPLMGPDLGVSRSDLQVVHDRVGAGGCIRAMRFSRDRISPRAKLDLIRREFPDAECVEIETRDRSLHSVLARAVEAPDEGQLGQALRDTIAFLDRHLRPAVAPPG